MSPKDTYTCFFSKGFCFSVEFPVPDQPVHNSRSLCSSSKGKHYFFTNQCFYLSAWCQIMGWWNAIHHVSLSWAAQGEATLKGLVSISSLGTNSELDKTLSAHRPTTSIRVNMKWAPAGIPFVIHKVLPLVLPAVTCMWDGIFLEGRGLLPTRFLPQVSCCPRGAHHGLTARLL